jgi:hypothetical protein
MARKKAAPSGAQIGVPLPGTPVDIKSSRENWSEYTLADGTTLRFKAIVVEVIRTDQYKPDGEPIYQVRSVNVADAKVPASLRKKVN